jgi:hypothetical protein
MSAHPTEMTVIEIIRSTKDVKVKLQVIRTTVSEIRDGDSTQVPPDAKRKQGTTGGQVKAKRAPRKPPSAKAKPGKRIRSSSTNDELKDSTEKQNLQELLLSELRVEVAGR